MSSNSPFRPGALRAWFRFILEQATSWIPAIFSRASLLNRVTRRNVYLWGWALFLMAVSSLEAPGFRITSIEPVGNNAFRLRWNTTAGRDYQIQRADSLLSSNNTPWLPVVTLRATGTVSVADDQAGVN